MKLDEEFVRNFCHAMDHARATLHRIGLTLTRMEVTREQAERLFGRQFKPNDTGRFAYAGEIHGIRLFIWPDPG